MLLNAKWITTEPVGTCPLFRKALHFDKPVRSATLYASAVGLYAAYLNGVRVGKGLLTPGCTEGRYRIQYQEYDVTDMLSPDATLELMAADGWALGPYLLNQTCNFGDRQAVIALLDVAYEDGSHEQIGTDESFGVYTSPILDSQIYHGESVDFTRTPAYVGQAVVTEVKSALVPQQGEWIVEQERIAPIREIITPKGERVIDFGQNLSGYVEVTLHGSETVTLSHAEVLDKDGNFYTENLRSAKCVDTYIGDGTPRKVKPTFTWQGFRYIRLDECGADTTLADFTAIVIHSEMTRTSSFVCGNPLLNQLYSNIVWGQKGNFIDIPTDCPQRDERLGWTGDAQAFVRTAAINFDVERFFRKWLTDMALSQRSDGAVGFIVPNCFKGWGEINEKDGAASTAWGDAAVICPWQVYQAYGNKEMLAEEFDMMQKWVEFMHHDGPEEYLWLDHWHFGDWLGLETEDSYSGDTDIHLIASAFYAYSTSLLVKAGEALGRDMSAYKELHARIVEAFKAHFLKDGLPEILTQTALVVMLYFGLCSDEKLAADTLVRLIRERNTHLTTGFVGTPYLLHALSGSGHADVAYDLLLQDTFPSWLFSVKQGATTMWEHWDGIKEDGSFWSADMNSYNHYAYGAVCDWMFGVAGGITVLDDGAGYKHVSVAPVPDARLGWLDLSIQTRCGRIRSAWKYMDAHTVRYDVTIPEGCTAEVKVGSTQQTLTAGSYVFYTEA